MADAPRLLLCAPASGGGKTTAVCALLQALKDRGARPAAFKSGPDYIDPMFHTSVTGVPAHNLDLFLMGEAGVRRVLGRYGAQAGVSVIEGAMGYYDGEGMSGEASAYDLARKTATPAVLVLDARGRALSAAALVHGFCSFRADSGIRGVLLNRIPAKLYPRLKAAIEAETGVTVYGYLPDLPEVALESRHLGLVTAQEVPDLREKLHKLAVQAEETVDLDGLLALARTAPALEEGEAFRLSPVPGRPRIAVARDSAFCFYYPAALDLLEELGAELVPFSPLADGGLPEGVSGLYLGGGYPEIEARALSENTAMLEALRGAIRGGMPTVAECGGFLYLHETVTDVDGFGWPGVGIIPEWSWNKGRLGRFGYVTLTARKGGLLCDAGGQMNAHEFHYWESKTPGADFHAQKPRSDQDWDCAHHTDTLYAGFPHMHFCGCPDAARRFVAACARYKEEA